MASRIVVLNRGVIAQVGSPLELYRNPDNLFVAGFLGAPRMNFFAVTVTEAFGGIAKVSAPGLEPLAVELGKGVVIQKGAALTLGIRPESVTIADQRASRTTMSGRARLVEHLGRETILHVDAGPLQCVGSESGTGTVTVQVGRPMGLANDAPIGLQVDPREVYLFSSGNERTITARKPILDR